MPILAREVMSKHRSPSATTSSPLQITEDDATSSVVGHEPLLHQEQISESLSEPDRRSFAVWGLSPYHQIITATEKQAKTFATYFSMLNLPLTYVTDHNSRVEAEIFLSL